MVRRFFILLLVLCAPVASGHAQRGRNTGPVSGSKPAASTAAKIPETRFVDKPETLKGITAMKVAVEFDPSDLPALKNRLRPEVLKTAVELRLRQSGIIVKPTDSRVFEPAFCIYVTLLEPDEGRGLFAYMISARFSRIVQLPSTKDEVVYADAVTWDTGGVMTVGSNNLPESIRNTVDQYVSQFLNTYLEQNPK